MFGRFFYGQCSLAEAFWKFSFLGLAVSGFVTRLLMIVGRIRNPLSAGSMEQHFPSEHESGCFYLAVLLYRSIFGRTDLFRRLYRRNVEHVQRIRKEQSPRFYLYASGLGNGLFCR